MARRSGPSQASDNGTGRWTRRGLVQAGVCSFLGLETLLHAKDSLASESHSPRAKSVLFVFIAGGPSHIDTFDPKPDSPAEVRGDWKAIASATPGVLVGEHLPRLAMRTDKYAIVRTMQCRRDLGAHDFATHAILSGIDMPPAGPTRAASRLAWPCFAAGVDAVRPRSDGLPSGIHLPIFLSDPTVGNYPGQDAGLLGPLRDPLQIRQDPIHNDFKVARWTLPVGMSFTRLDERMQLLHDLDRQRRDLVSLAESESMTEKQQRAVRFLSDGRLARAFDLDRESDRVRDIYGRHTFGQSMLLGRRLVQAGVPVVQVNLAAYNAQWDTHSDNFNLLENQLLPPFDQSLSALLDDLHATGLADETLLVVAGEFGRTPKIGGNLGTPTFSPTGRDHWTECFFALFAGAGVQAGQVIGSSDRIGASPITQPYTPSDLGATIYEALGIDPHSWLRDVQGRPFRLNDGQVISPLYHS